MLSFGTSFDDGGHDFGGTNLVVTLLDRHAHQQQDCCVSEVEGEAGVEIFGTAFLRISSLVA